MVSVQIYCCSPSDDPPSSSAPRVLVLRPGAPGSSRAAVRTACGAEVWATCGERNRALVEEAGAARVFDHRTVPLSDLPAAFFGGRLTPVIERVWGFAEAPAALVHLETGHTTGKTVVRIGD